MKHGSKLVPAALAAGALGAAATVFAHPGERGGDGKQGAADCPMHTAMQQGEHQHRMGQGGHGKMEHRGMGQGMRHGQAQIAPKSEEAPKQ
jgi:hypothetical protein